MINLNLSKNGYELLTHFEGLRLDAYDDAHPERRLMQGNKIAGTLTIGHGHTGIDVYIGQVITPDAAQILLEKDVMWAVRDVNKYTLRSPSQQQFDAMVVLCFNIGSLAFKNSSVLREFNKNDDDRAANSFKMWHLTTINGVKTVSEGLCRRRFSEAWLYLIGSVNKNPQGWVEFYRTCVAARKNTSKKAGK